MGQSVNLRTLARKSVLGYGKHALLTVQQLLDLKEYAYISWSYFVLSNISFADDILNLVGVTEEFRITKPGKDEAALQRFKDYRLEHRTGYLKEKIEKIGRKKTIGSNVARRNRDRIAYSKGNLQRMNHGRGK